MMDTAFFIFSKLVGLALQVETWLAIGMTLSLVGGIFARPRLGHRSGGVTLAVFLIVGVFPVGEVLLRPLETAFPPRVAPAQIDGIVVLGGVEDQRVTAAWGQPQLNEAAERLTAAATFAMEHPDARLLFSGGSGRLRDTVVGRPPIPSVAVDCPSSDNLGRLSAFRTGGSGSPLVDAMRFQFVGASAGRAWFCV